MAHTRWSVPWHKGNASEPSVDAGRVDQRNHLNSKSVPIVFPTGQAVHAHLNVARQLLQAVRLDVSGVDVLAMVHFAPFVSALVYFSVRLCNFAPVSNIHWSANACMWVRKSFVRRQAHDDIHIVIKKN